MNQIKSLSIYGISNFLNKAISFVLLITITHYLLPSELGMYSLFSVYVSLLFPLIHLGVINGIQVEYFKLKKSELTQYISSSLVFPFIVFVIISICVWIFKVQLSKLINIPANWLIFIPFLAFIKIIPTIVSAIYRSMEDAFKYALFNSSIAISSLLFTVFFIVALKMNWEGRVLGVVIPLILFFILGVFILKKKGLLIFSIKNEYKYSSLKFGVPLIPHLLSVVLIDASDRLFIGNIIGVHEVGIYNIGYKFGALVTLFQATIINVWNPFVYKNLNEGTWQSKKAIVKYGLLYTGAIFAFVVLLSGCSPFFFNYIIDSQYYEGLQFVFWISLGYGFFALFNFLSVFLLYTKHTAMLSALSVINVILNLLLNYWLISIYGAIGAAYATTASFILIFLATFILVYKTTPLPWLFFLRSN